MKGKFSSRPKDAVSGKKSAKSPKDLEEVNISDLPDPLIFSILSLLSPRDISSCRKVSRRFQSLCEEDRGVWLLACERRWGSKTQIMRWGCGNVMFRYLYAVLSEWENLIGFWRGVRHAAYGPLIIFEWSNNCIVGSRVSPVTNGSYDVCKIPFLWLGILGEGQRIGFVDPRTFNIDLADDVAQAHVQVSSSAAASNPLEILCKKNGVVNSINPFENGWDFCPHGMIAIEICPVGPSHIVVEEKQYVDSSENVSPLPKSSSSLHLPKGKEVCFDSSSYGKLSPPAKLSPSSAPERLDSEIHKYFSNKVSQSGASRRQRKEHKRKEKENKKIWEALHFVKIFDCTPTPARPLQGLWKGISCSMGLDFILVSYDEMGGIVCRKVGGSSQTFSASGSVFWTAHSGLSNDIPLCDKEEKIYSTRLHVKPSISFLKDVSKCFLYEEEEIVKVFRIEQKDILPVTSEGRVWLYASGNFGYGVSHNSSIIDFRLISSSLKLWNVT